MNLKAIFEEYSPNILEDEDFIYKIKLSINKLSETDRALLILYADTGSLEKTGKLLGVSDTTVYINIKRIRDIIKNDIQR